MRKTTRPNDDKWLLIGPITSSNTQDSSDTLNTANYAGKLWTRWVGMFFCIAVLALVLRAFFLQVASGQAYVLVAENNRIRDVVSYAPRGDIYDRDGKLLAKNSAQFQLSVTPYLLARDEKDRELTYQLAGKYTSQTASEVRLKAEQKGLDFTLPILAADRLSHKEALMLEQVLPDMKGFSVDVVPIREYVADAGLAHLIGYVGRVSEQDLAKRDDILPTDFIGRNGVEAYYDEWLRGTNGRRRSEVDALGRPVRLLAKNLPRKGNDLVLTIDYDLQVELDRELKKQMKETGAKRASGVIADPGNGDILAMVSIPYYDNNLFAQGISSRDYQSLLKNPDRPLLNRTIAGVFPSGSTIKPIVAAGALNEGIIDETTTIFDRGFIEIRNPYNTTQSYRFHGWRRSGLGAMDVRRAIAYSSNIFFYTVGGGYGNQPGLGVDRLTHYYSEFGLGKTNGIDLPSEVSGRVPTPKWKQQAMGEPWYIGDTYNISIGQGDILVTPLQMTMAYAALSNGGMVPSPSVVRHDKSDGSSGSINGGRQVQVSEEALLIVRKALNDMPYRGVFSPERFSDIPVQIAGKTGTAQVSNPGGSGKPHGWFIAFAPYEDPEIVATVLIENTDGSTTALTPVANVLEYYFNLKNR